MLWFFCLPILWVNSATDLSRLQPTTVRTAKHCRSFRDDDILKRLEQFCGLHFDEPVTTRTSWREHWLGGTSVYSQVKFQAPVEFWVWRPPLCLASYYLHNYSSAAYPSSWRALPRRFACWDQSRCRNLFPSPMQLGVGMACAMATGNFVSLVCDAFRVPSLPAPLAGGGAWHWDRHDFPAHIDSLWRLCPWRPSGQADLRGHWERHQL